MLSSVLLTSAGAIAVLMAVTWLVSLLVQDASIVDLIWGFGFAVVAAAFFPRPPKRPPVDA